jgi:hypothetical protein
MEEDAALEITEGMEAGRGISLSLLPRRCSLSLSDARSLCSIACSSLACRWTCCESATRSCAWRTSSVDRSSESPACSPPSPQPSTPTRPKQPPPEPRLPHHLPSSFPAAPRPPSAASRRLLWLPRPMAPSQIGPLSPLPPPGRFLRWPAGALARPAPSLSWDPPRPTPTSSGPPRCALAPLALSLLKSSGF